MPTILQPSHITSTCPPLSCNTLSKISDTPYLMSSSSSPINFNNTTNLTNNHLEPLISDTGATGIYLPPSHAALLNSINANHTPITVQLPNNEQLTSTMSGSISLGYLPSSALSSHVFPQLTKPLLGTAQLCDNDLTVIYTKQALTILDPNGQVLLQTPRTGSLWTIPITPTQHTTSTQKPRLPHVLPYSQTPVALNLYPISADHAATCLFWQRAFYSPCKSTMMHAARAGLFQEAGLSILTPTFISKHYVNTVATAKGHLNRTRQNYQSTKSPSSAVAVMSPPPGLPKPKDIRIAIFEPTGQHYSDATTTFPSSPFHLLIMYHYDTNYIHIEVCKDNSAATYLTAYNNGLALYAQASTSTLSLIPTMEKADNAVTLDFIKKMKSRGIHVQLTPASNHRTNNAERCIQTAKNHLVAGYHTADPDFPVKAMHNLVPQAEITLNILRKSRLSNRSAYTEIHGPFDSNRFRLHPPGTKLVTLDDPNKRPKQFAEHGPIAFYLHPAPHQYRSYTVYCPSTNATRITDSVSWLPFERTIPTYATLDPQLQDRISESPATETTIADPVSDFLPTTGDDLINSEGGAPVSTVSLPIVSPTSQLFPTPAPQQSSPLLSQTSMEPIQLFASEGASLDVPPSNLSANSLSASFVHYLQSIKGPDYERWEESMHTEMVRLITKTKSMTLMPSNTVPEGARVGHANPITKIKYSPLDAAEAIEWRTRLSWNQSALEDAIARITSSTTADTTLVKLLINSAISDPNAVLSTIDVDDFYLNTLLQYLAFLWVPLRYLPLRTRQWLGVADRPLSEKILFQVHTAIYGMDDAGRLSQDQLVAHLASHGYTMCPHTPGLFLHATRSSIQIVNYVDDFLVKHDKRTDDFKHLCTTLQRRYPIKIEPVANRFLGIRINLFRHPTINTLSTVTLDMPTYARKGLESLGFTPTHNPRSPIIYEAPQYGAAQQFAHVDSSPPATPEQQSYLRKAVGIFRHMANAVDNILLVPLSRLASKQSCPSTQDMKNLDRTLNYIYHHPDAQIIYRPSDMQLHVHSDASYLSEPESRSRAAGVSTCGPIIFNGIDKPYYVNGPIRITSSIISSVVGSAMEAEYAGMYTNAQDATVDRQTLLDLGHPQIATNMRYDNTTAGNLANRTAKVKRSKAIDMRFHWIQDRVQQGHFKLNWAPGTHNLADFPSKAHPIHHFEAMRPLFVTYPTPDAYQTSVEKVC